MGAYTTGPCEPIWRNYCLCWRSPYRFFRLNGGGPWYIILLSIWERLGRGKMRDFLSIADLTRGELEFLLQRARDIKRGILTPSLPGKHLALVFQKPSLRTRVSFEVGMRQMGGDALYLTSAEVGMAVREPIKDVARVLSRYVDVIAVRTFAQADIVELAEHASVPVINALSDDEHPCQALADLLTLQEKLEDLRGATLAYVGDGNNVAASLILGASLLG